MAELRPEARVFLQSRNTGEIVLMDNFTNISTTVSLDGGDASIAFSNANDRVFAKNTRERDFGGAAGQFVRAYAEEVFNLKLVAEINAMRRSVSNDLRAGRATFVTIDQWLRMEMLAEIDLMNRIWIDFRGRDGRWYAGFTGLTSGVTDDFRIPGAPTFTVGCKDLRRLLQVSQIITAGGDLGLLFATQQDLITQATVPQAFNTLQNVFANIEDPAGVIGTVIDLVNKFFGVFAGTSGTTAALFGTDKIWNLPAGSISAPARQYGGLIHVRDDAPLQTTGPQVRLDGISDPDRALKVNPTFSQVTPGQTFGYGRMAYLVDRSISFQNLEPMRKVMRSAFEIFGVERSSADRIIREVTAITFYDFWCDAMGNVIFQRPRYDDLPNTEVLNFETGADQGVGYDPKHDVFLKRGDAHGSDFAGLRDHGRNYLLGDESLKRKTVSLDESGLYTVATVGTALDFISLGALLEKTNYTGVALAPAELQRLLGTRVFSGKAPVSASVDIQKRYLDRAAAALLRRLNAQASTMSAELVQRPDLQPGRTMLDVERGKLYYLQGVTNDYTQGEEHTTTVRGNFGHLPEQPIGDAWLRDESFEAVISASKSLADIGRDTNAKVLKATSQLDSSFLQQPSIPIQNFPKLGL